MTTITAVHSLAIPGLNSPVTKDVLLASGPAYNQFDACPKNKVPELHHVDALGAILVSHEMHHKFGVHLVHRHTKAPPGTVMVGHNGTWLREAIRTEPAEIDGIDVENLHGHIFWLSGDGLRPYEYRLGPSPDMTSVKSDFLSEVVKYIEGNQLCDLLGLQFLSGKKPMVEFDCKRGGTVMVPGEIANYGKILQTSGWSFRSGQREETEQHAQTTSGPHRVFF